MSPRTQIGGVLKIDKLGLRAVVGTDLTEVVDWEVDLEVIVYIYRSVPLVKNTNESTNRVKAKIAVIIVQQQSVHFLCFYSTGRFLNVNTFFWNIAEYGFFVISFDPFNF